jgi:hypothetical protein
VVAAWVAWGVGLRGGHSGYFGVADAPSGRPGLVTQKGPKQGCEASQAGLSEDALGVAHDKKLKGPGRRKVRGKVTSEQ